MKNLYIFFLLLFSGNLLCAQTWTGSAGTNWNTPANWNTGIVPTGTSNVVIPGELPNAPVFSGHVTINSIYMQNGSRLSLTSRPSLREPKLAHDGLRHAVLVVHEPLLDLLGLADEFALE